MFGGEDIGGERGQMRETDVETRAAEEIKHQRAEGNNKVMQDVLREKTHVIPKSLHLVLLVSHMLEAQRTIQGCNVIKNTGHTFDALFLISPN